MVGIAEEEKRRQGQLHKALWVLVVDNHHQESDWSHSYDPQNRDWKEKSDQYTAMAQGSNTTRGDDDWKYTGDVVVSMFAGARAGYLNVRRKRRVGQTGRVLALPNIVKSTQRVVTTQAVIMIARMHQMS